MCWDGYDPCKYLIGINTLCTYWRAHIWNRTVVGWWTLLIDIALYPDPDVCLTGVDFQTSVLRGFDPCENLMTMMTSYGAWTHPCCNSMLIALERLQSSSWLFLSFMVRGWHVYVAIIHRTLTGTTGSLSCAQMLLHAIAHGGVRTPKWSLHWKLTLGIKSLAAPGDRACVSGVTVPCSNQLSYIPSPGWKISS